MRNCYGGRAAKSHCDEKRWEGERSGNSSGREKNPNYSLKFLIIGKDCVR